MNRNRIGLVVGIAALVTVCVPLVAVAGNPTSLVGVICPTSTAGSMDVLWTGRDPKAVEFGGTLAPSITSVVRDNKANVFHVELLAAPVGLQTLTVSLFAHTKAGSPPVDSDVFPCTIT